MDLLEDSNADFMVAFMEHAKLAIQTILAVAGDHQE